MKITKAEIKKTFTRIENKFNSFNYQPGVTFPRSIAPWYVVITELRLLFLSPLVVIVNTEKWEKNKEEWQKKENELKQLEQNEQKFPKNEGSIIEIIKEIQYLKEESIHYNIKYDEFWNYIYPDFLPTQRKNDMFFFPYPNKTGKYPKDKYNIKINSIIDTNVFFVKYEKSGNNEFWDKIYKNIHSNEEPLWDNSNLDRIDSAIVVVLDNWCVWIFGNYRKYENEIEISPNLKFDEWESGWNEKLYNSLKNLFDKYGDIILQHETENRTTQEEIEKKDLFPIWKYKKYYEENANIFEPISILNTLELDDKKIKERIKYGIDKAVNYIEKNINKNRFLKLTNEEFKKEDFRRLLKEFNENYPYQLIDQILSHRLIKLTKKLLSKLNLIQIPDKVKEDIKRELGKIMIFFSIRKFWQEETNQITAFLNTKATFRFQHRSPYMTVLGLEATPYFAIISHFFNKTYGRVRESLKQIRLNNHLLLLDDDFFEIFFNTLDVELIYSTITPSRSNLFEVKRDMENGMENFLIGFQYSWDWHVYPGITRGISGYINETNYPEFVLALKIIDDKTGKTTDRRLEIHEDTLFFLGLKKGQSNNQFFLVPSVFTLLPKDEEIFLNAIRRIIQDEKSDIFLYPVVTNRINEEIEKYFEKKQNAEDTFVNICIRFASILGKKSKLAESILTIIGLYVKTVGTNGHDLLNKIQSQIPQVANRINEIIKKHTDLELGIKVIYNFSFNSQLKESENLLERLRTFWQSCFDLTFDAMFGAGTIQREQNMLFKATLFEEATDSFKKAMKFPLIEES